jgi:hypothetical protein
MESPGKGSLISSGLFEPYMLGVDMLQAEYHPDSTKTSYTDRIRLGCGGKL